MTDMDVTETQPTKSEIITVENKLLDTGSADSPKLNDLFDCKADGYCLWCCCGFCFPLPTACCIGHKMGDKYAWLKFTIPGKLINNLILHQVSPAQSTEILVKFFQYPKAIILLAAGWCIYYFIGDQVVMLIVYLSAAIIIGLLYLYQRRYVSNAPNLYAFFQHFIF